MWSDARPFGTIPRIDHEQEVLGALFSVRDGDKRALAARSPRASRDADEQNDVGSCQCKAGEADVPKRVEMRERPEDCRGGSTTDEECKGTATALDTQLRGPATNPARMFVLKPTANLLDPQGRITIGAHRHERRIVPTKDASGGHESCDRIGQMAFGESTHRHRDERDAPDHHQ